MENEAGIPRRLADLERQVAALSSIVGQLVPLLGGINATLARLGSEAAESDLYEERFDEMEADIKRLLAEIREAWPMTGDAA